MIRNCLIALVCNVFSWLLYLLLLITLYFGFIRDFQMNWGASDIDINRKMMGDELLENPELNATRGIEIDGTPEEIWPWIVQIGYNRAGFYGFDNLDNGGISSSYGILLDFQNMQVGDSIPGGEYKGQVFNILEVAEINPGKEMLWVFLKGTPWGGATWSWGLYPIDEKRTKLISRLRHKYTLESFQDVVLWGMIDAIEILMMRTTLRGIKCRVESSYSD